MTNSYNMAYAASCSGSPGPSVRSRSMSSDAAAFVSGNSSPQRSQRARATA